MVWCSPDITSRVGKILPDVKRTAHLYTYNLLLIYTLTK